MKEQLSRAGSLFGTFFKIGAFTFGGGYAMIPLIQREVVEKRHWIEQSDILDIVAIAESTPGPIAINTATFVGYRTGGFLGAACATLGVVLPSFAVIFALSFVLRQFQARGWVTLETRPEDRRSKTVRLTAAGEAAALPLHREIIDHERRVWEALGEDTVDTLMAIQARYIRTFREVQA